MTFYTTSEIQLSVKIGRGNKYISNKVNTADGEMKTSDKLINSYLFSHSFYAFDVS